MFLTVGQKDGLIGTKLGLPIRLDPGTVSVKSNSRSRLKSERRRCENENAVGHDSFRPEDRYYSTKVKINIMSLKTKPAAKTSQL